MSRGGGVFKAFLTGTAVGAALGLLFAPDSGEKTRERIMELGEMTRDTVDNKSRDLKERIYGLRGEINELTNRAVESGQKRVHEELEALKTAFEEGSRKLQEERERRLSGEASEEE